MISYWEQSSFIQYDYIIIGAGLMGLHLAYELSEKEPNARIVILERGIFPSGASTKNAGFACFGSLSEIAADIEMNGLDASLSLIEKRYQGIALLKERIGIEALGYQNHGGYELLYENHLPVLEQLDQVNQHLFPIFKSNVFSVVNEKINAFGLASSAVKSLIYSPFEGQIHSGRMMQSFIKKIMAKGIQIINGASVKALEGNQVHVFHPILNEIISFKAAKNILVATNALASELLQKPIAMPGRGQIILTEPIADLKLKGVFHIDEGYYYFRNIENRVLFGGGRNLDFKGEESAVFENTELITNELIRILHEVILPDQKVEIQMKWAGIMGFTENKLPIIQRINEHTVVAMSCNGMGVALSGMMAKEAFALL